MRRAILCVVGHTWEGEGRIRMLGQQEHTRVVLGLSGLWRWRVLPEGDDRIGTKTWKSLVCENRVLLVGGRDWWRLAPRCMDRAEPLAYN